ncbi:type II toxin-antitoxin system toxin TsaT [Staphylococcus durrellii]|uniref:type II toxin-antitoxin system toxin TsaT n=1 Tax=Staphylococcus durrellii TaxID=2781773 RepID=UPI0018A0D872|nr:hypothetical protein [Staphylococcus durrellii]MBF7017588.1 hypothetical protein [Staphylococcus durrellii]
MSLHFAIVFWLSFIFLIAGIITFILYKLKKPSEGKDSLLGVTVMLLIFGIVGILFSLIFS